MNMTPDRTSEEPYLSVIIPAYNEEARLGRTVMCVEEYLRHCGYSWELIVVDDGSTDDTVRVATAAFTSPHSSRVLRNPRNMGKGASVRAGMLAAKGRYRLFSDADLSTPIEEVEKLLRALQGDGAEVAIGSRRMKDSHLEQRQPFYRELMGWVFNLLVRALVLPNIRDTQCGFKLFTADAADHIFPKQRLDGFSFDVETLVLAARQGYRIEEVPVRWIDSPASRVRAVRDSYHMFLDVVTTYLRSDLQPLRLAPQKA